MVWEDASTFCVLQHGWCGCMLSFCLHTHRGSARSCWCSYRSWCTALRMPPPRCSASSTTSFSVLPPAKLLPANRPSRWVRDVLWIICIMCGDTPIRCCGELWVVILPAGVVNHLYHLWCHSCHHVVTLDGYRCCGESSVSCVVILPSGFVFNHPYPVWWYSLLLVTEYHVHFVTVIIIPCTLCGCHHNTNYHVHFVTVITIPCTLCGCHHNTVYTLWLSSQYHVHFVVFIIIPVTMYTLWLPS